jgi:hypothetical protein
MACRAGHGATAADVAAAEGCRAIVAGAMAVAGRRAGLDLNAAINRRGVRVA